MRVIEQSFEILDELDGDKILKKLEKCARVCYKSEDNICDGSDRKLLSTIIKLGHESVLEHYSFTVRFITTRSVSLELVRHRLASYSQESQRYVDYGGKDLAFILPNSNTDKKTDYIYKCAFNVSETIYKELRMLGVPQQFARAVLPNACATEIVVSANIREWRHILKLRTSRAAHPDIRGLLIPLLNELQSTIPVLFDDIRGE